MAVFQDTDGTYILVACISKHNDWETLQRGNKAAPSNHSYHPPIRHGVSLSKMVDNEYDEISNRYQCHNTGIFQGIKSPKKREWNNDEPVETLVRDIQTRKYDAHMKTVTQKCLSTRNGTESAPSLKPLTTPGMRSPMIIK